MRVAVVAVFVVMILNLSFPVCCVAASGEIDATTVVVQVHDGDTFTLDRTVEGSSRVRLADVDAPELGQPLSYEARGYLKGLVLSKTVYLDIDDVYRYDNRGTGDRLVCVVYVDYNITHYENVNKAIGLQGLPKSKNTITNLTRTHGLLYVPKTNLIPEFPIFILLPVSVLLTTAAATLIVRRRHGSRRKLPQANAIRKEGGARCREDIATAVGT